jgi:hypothetical protein
MRLAWVAIACAACSSPTDDRPLTIEYITGTILQPTCGAADCHSAFAANRTDVFDNVDGARRSLVDNGLIRFTSAQYDPSDPAEADLILWLTQTDPFGLGYGRMPLDGPMPNADIVLLENWIIASAPGAECDPSLKTACNDHDLVECNDDWNFGSLMQTCTGTCALTGSGAVCQ